MRVAHWYSSGWNRCVPSRSINVIETGARRRARAANRPPNPPPMMTTRAESLVRFIACSRSARVARLGRVVPGNSIWQQAVGLLGALAVVGVVVERDGVPEDRVDDAPAGFDGVRACEQPPLVRERGADQPVVGPYLGQRLFGERKILPLQRPARRSWLLAGQPQ